MMPPPSALLVVPRRPLRRLPVALEHPVAELAAHREDAAEEAGVDQHLELEQARQEQLVLHHAVLDRRPSSRRARDRARRRACRRPASRNRCPCRPRSPSCSSSARSCVVAASKNNVSFLSLSAASRSVVQRAMPCALASFASLSALRPTRIGSGITRSPFFSATPPWSRIAHDRADQVLVHPHAAGDAVHDDAEPLLQPCTSVQPSCRSRSSCSLVSTPSAVVVMPRLLPSAATARTMATLSGVSTCRG